MDYLASKLFPGSEVDFYEVTPRQIHRRKPMKVLVLGVSRTGNATMCTALQVLGITPYHFLEAKRNKDNGHMQLWRQAIQAKYDGQGRPFQGIDFDQMLWNYDAVTDAPCCLFVEELVAAYPDAKVVLTSRTGESWLASMKATILEQISWRSWSLLALVDRDFSRPYWALLNSVVSVWSCGLPAWRPSSHPVMMKSMEEHNALVRRVVPPERLLEFHPSDGWAPLCEFLDVPTPDMKFPHVNDGKYFVGFHVSLYWRRWFHAALGAGRVVATLGLAIGLGYYWAAAQ